MKRTLFITRVLIAILFYGTLHAQTPQPQNLLFIFDASGSMWGKLGQSTKIQVARETMGTLSEKISPAAQVGLIAYGHRSASDCNDIEMLIPMAPFDRNLFNSKIKSLNPKGKTPIAKSIAKAVEAIKGMTNPVTVILITDGLETCEGNGCDVVKQAKEAGVKITMHVVGFGITDKDLSSLECIAQAGGGQYLPAGNADELSKALENTVEEIPAGDAFLSVKTLLQGKLTDATVKVTKKGEAKEMITGRTYESPETNPRVMQLPSGTYDLVVQAVNMDSRPSRKIENAELRKGDTLYHEISFDQGVVEITVTRNGALADATVQLFSAGINSVVTTTRTYTKPETNPAKLNIPPGSYDLVIASVEISGKPEKKYSNIELGSAGNQKFAHNFESGELTVGAAQGSLLVDAVVSIINTKTGKSVATGRTYQSADSNPKTFILEPGSYRVELNPVKPAGLSKKNFTVEVPAGGHAEQMGNW
jgi:Ca-activated chloride channel family protein